MVDLNDINSKSKWLFALEIILIVALVAIVVVDKTN